MFLTVAAPSLASVVPGLPNDHYHAFADPMVVVLVGLGLTALVVGRRPRGPGRRPASCLVALVGWNLTHQPPAVHPDGGWPAGEAAGDRVDARPDARPGIDRDAVVVLRSLPDFKSTEAVAYPLVRLGRAIDRRDAAGRRPGQRHRLPADAGRLGAAVRRPVPRGRPGRRAAVRPRMPEAAADGFGPLLDRFEAAPGRWISVYGPA